MTRQNIRNGVCLALLVLSVVVTRASDSQETLSPELAEIVRRNSETLSRMRTCSAIVESSVWFTEEGHEGSYQNIHSIWVKDRKIRDDFIADPASQLEKRRIRIEREGDDTVLYYGPAVESKLITTPECIIRYTPESSDVSMTPGDTRLPYGERVSLLHEFVSVGRNTLEQQVRENAGQGYLPSISDITLQDVPCKLLEWDYPEYETAMKIWVVPSKGFMMKKLQIFYKDKLAKDWTARIKEYEAGVFWVEAVEEEQWSKDTLRKRTNLKMTKLQANVPVDDKLFTVADLDIPPGVEVQDKLVGLRYRYGVPFELPEDFVDSVVGSAQPTERTFEAAKNAPETPEGSLDDGGGARDTAPDTSPSGFLAADKLPWLIAVIAGLALFAVFVASVARIRRLRHAERGKNL